MHSLLCHINGEDFSKPALYAHAVVIMDSSLWIEGSRERVFILLVHRDLKSEAFNHLDILHAAVGLCNEVCQEATTMEPASMESLLLPPSNRFLADRLANMQAGGQRGKSLIRRACHESSPYDHHGTHHRI